MYTPYRTLAHVLALKFLIIEQALPWLVTQLLEPDGPPPEVNNINFRNLIAFAFVINLFLISSDTLHIDWRLARQGQNICRPRSLHYSYNFPQPMLLVSLAIAFFSWLSEPERRVRTIPECYNSEIIFRRSRSYPVLDSSSLPFSCVYSEFHQRAQPFA